MHARFQNPFSLDSFKRPLIAFVTVFAYLNMIFFPFNQALAGLTELQDEMRQIAPLKIKGQVKGYLTELDNFNADMTAVKGSKPIAQQYAIQIPAVDVTQPVWQLKFTRIGHILAFIVGAGEVELHDNENAIKYEHSLNAEIGRLSKQLQTLKSKITTTFKSSEHQKKVRGTLKKHAKWLTKEQTISKDHLAWLEFQQDDDRYEQQKRTEAYAQFKQLECTQENLGKANGIFKRVLARYNVENLPEHLQADIKRYGLNASLFEEMENSDWDVISALGKFGQGVGYGLKKLFTSSEVQTAATVVTAAQAIPAAAAALQLVTPQGINYIYTEDQNLLLVPNPIEVTGVANSTSVTCTLQSSKSFAGSLLPDTSYPGVSMATPAKWVITQTAQNLTFVPLEFVPTPDVFDNLAYTVVCTDGITSTNGRFFTLTGTNIPDGPVGGPCDLGTVRNNEQVPLASNSNNCQFSDSDTPATQITVTAVQAQNCFTALISAPTVPSSFTVAQAQSTPSAVIVKSTGNNLPCTLLLQAQDPQGRLSNVVNVTSNFVPDRQTTGAPIEGGALAGVVIGAVGLFALVMTPLGWYVVNKRSRVNYPIAEYLWSRMGLDTPNFESGNGQTYKDSIQRIISGLKVNHGVDVASMDDDPMYAFCDTCLIPAFRRYVTLGNNNCIIRVFFGRKKVNLEDLQAPGTEDNIIQWAANLYGQQVPNAGGKTTQGASIPLSTITAQNNPVVGARARANTPVGTATAVAGAGSGGQQPNPAFQSGSSNSTNTGGI